MSVVSFINLWGIFYESWGQSCLFIISYSMRMLLKIERSTSVFMTKRNHTQDYTDLCLSFHFVNIIFMAEIEIAEVKTFLESVLRLQVSFYFDKSPGATLLAAYRMH